jgi:hypothetical protein
VARARPRRNDPMPRRKIGAEKGAGDGPGTVPHCDGTASQEFTSMAGRNDGTTGGGRTWNISSLWTIRLFPVLRGPAADSLYCLIVVRYVKYRPERVKDQLRAGPMQK